MSGSRHQPAGLPGQGGGGAGADPGGAVPAARYPELRYMGSKHRLLPWLGEVIGGLECEVAMDPFCGSGAVAYLLKRMGKRVIASDYLLFPSVIARATVENDAERLDGPAAAALLRPNPGAGDFVEKTFADIFYDRADLAFLDRVSANLEQLASPLQRCLGLAALLRGCLKKQPRGVFTVAGKRYDDGRRDLRLSLQEHFLEQVPVYNACVFDNGRRHRVSRADVFEVDPAGVDLVYLDPPYVPRADDNDYLKRYHFLEGLAGYWREVEILPGSKVRKLRKRFTPFAYRRTAVAAFAELFARFAASKIVLSYGSNGYPELPVLVGLLKRHKSRVVVHRRAHRYHFGTHARVRPERARAQEFLVVGT